MRTPSHILYNLVILGKQGQTKRNWAVAIGGFLPDSATFLFFFIYGVILKTPPRRIWSNLYFHSAWNHVFNLLHSFWLLPLLLIVCLLLRWRIAAYLFGSMLLHAVNDFFVHHNDAYAHFWPFSTWKFHSPISYWNPRYYGNYVTVIAVVLDAVCVVILLRRWWKARRAAREGKAPAEPQS